MGFSATKAAFDTMGKWTAACLANSGMQNRWTDQRGNTYFFENSRRIQPDASITGTICKENPGKNTAKRVGSFKINPDGSVKVAPKFLKDASK